MKNVIIASAAPCKPVKIMNRLALEEEWRQLAPAWIAEMRAGRNPARRGLLDPVVVQACGDVRGLRVLDCGCGEGRFSRMLAENGAANVLGIDLCPPMVEAAAALATGRDAYRLADAQDLSFLADESFDLAISYLNQCDLPDFEANTREVFRVLRAAARFVAVNVHPMRSAAGPWVKAGDGSRQHYILDRYFDEGARTYAMLGATFTNFHRALSTYLRAYREAGFVIEDIVEPRVTAENLALFPELDDELRVPNFIVFVLRKP